MRRNARLFIFPVALLAAACSSDKVTGPNGPKISPRNALAAGDKFTCVLVAQGAAECWGANDVGQLGRGTIGVSASPALVSGGHHFTQIAATMSTACAVADDGSAWCWGANHGALGNGSIDSSAVPVPVSGGLHFQAVAGAGRAFCGLTAAAGNVYCWGSNDDGQLGNGAALAFSLVPVPVSGNQSFTGLTAALWAACGLTSSGSAYCWGANSLHQLGTGSTAQPVTTPTAVSGGLSFSDMKLGSATSCGIAGGNTYCWGTNFFGSLGMTDATTDVLGPTLIAGGPAFTSIFPGGGNDIFTPVCALTSAGAAYCWGANHSGQLGTTATSSTCLYNSGTGQTVACSSTPLAVTGGLAFQVLGIGAEHVCGITTNGQVACWGLNDRGQLGGGTSAATSSSPVIVAGLRVRVAPI